MSPSHQTVHVLLVEDNEVDIEGVRRAFRKHRIANPLHVARDGIEALAMLRGEDGAEPVPRPRIVLLDLNMPRMNGIECLQAIRADEALEDTVVFVLTTSKRDEDMMASYKRHVAGYMVKSEIGEGFLGLVGLLDHYWRVIELPQGPS